MADATLAELLEREFSRLRRESKRKLETLKDQADELGLDVGSLSRFRSGTRPLTRQRAVSIAAKLRGKGEDDPEVTELADHLLVARTGTQPTSDQVKVEEWFKEQAQEEGLMLVEFRESPALNPEGDRQDLVAVVGGAVATGQSYGMFLPFNLESSALPRLPIPLRNYLAALKVSVFSTYRAILYEVLGCVRDEPRTKEDRLVAMVKATERLKLYGLKAPDQSNCPAIGYRLFYVERHATAIADRHASRWEWISPGGTTQMIQKESSPEELNAVAIRFFPVVEHWRAKQRLPATSAELLEFASKIDKPYLTGLELSESQWEVLDERPGQEIVEKFFKEIPTPTERETTPHRRRTRDRK